MAAKKRVSLPLDEMTDRQLLLHVVIPALNALEKKMSDLGTAVADLQSAVDGVAQRLLPEIAALEDALAAAQSDDADAAAAAADAAAAVANIRTEVDRLNALGSDPTTPVDPEAPPVEPPVVETPADPNAPHPDNTLPNPDDQPHPDQSLPGDQPVINPLD
jgi:hypothetical protein